MSDKENLNRQNQEERPLQDRKPEIDINKGRTDEGFNRERPDPVAWQPVIDQTSTIPPDGGSGVGDSDQN
ncbi:MAG: hypothetical protein ACERIH_00195 [Labilibaculum antarcticum]